ncbi:hypothetical protein L1887_19486 [Cichorium endivia]|nr:hypothetical protein L1887_19486 [Cichorium endivia]
MRLIYIAPGLKNRIDVFPFSREVDVKKEEGVAVVAEKGDEGEAVGGLICSLGKTQKHNMPLDSTRMEDDERREAAIASSACLNPKFTATSDGAKPRLSKFQVAVAGGDGTAGWILRVISDLNLSQSPPVAIVPLGTEKNLPQFSHISCVFILNYRADEWDMNKWASEGTMKVVSKGEECIIRLEDKATGELYARAFLRDGEPHPVEPVIDSSRYFVLRVEENIGFRERPQAYDFQAALHDHMKYISNPLLPHCAKRLDYSLKDGQTIVLQLKNAFNLGYNSCSLKAVLGFIPKLISSGGILANYSQGLAPVGFQCLLKIVRSLDTMVDVRTRHEYGR